MLPEDLRPLYKRIEMVRTREDYIPYEVRDRLLEEHMASRFSFRSHSTPRADATWDALQDIMLETKEAVDERCHEAARNNHVYTPLKLVYTSRTQYPEDPYEEPLLRPGQKRILTGARVVNIMSANIWGEYIPRKVSNQRSETRDTASLSGSEVSLACSVSIDGFSESGTPTLGLGTHSRSDSKKVDYVLATDAGDDTALQKVLSRIILHQDACERNLVPHVNQTHYRPLKNSPIACSIETKIDGAVGQDPMLQLGIWLAAWHKRMDSLRRFVFKKFPSLWHHSRGQDRLPSTSLIKAVGQEWRLFFCCHKGSSVVMYGPLTIGSTEPIIDAYALIASLEAVKEWMETTFLTGVERWLLCDAVLESTERSREV